MAIKSSRTNGVAAVRIDHDRCCGCQLCVKVCKGDPLYWENGKVQVDQTRGFGCYGCGHCMAICPQNCITVEGRCLLATDVVERKPDAVPADYQQLYDLMLQRRSIRNFTGEEISQEHIKQILAAAVTAPMGVPPSEVGVVVLDGRDKVAAFAADLIGCIRKIKWLFARPAVYALSSGS